MNSFPDPVVQHDLKLDENSLKHWDLELAGADAFFDAAYPGPPGPGPIHTVYIPVPRFTEQSIIDWSTQALGATTTFADQWADLLTELAGDRAAELGERTIAKVAVEPIEDLRIDFEDGFRAHRGTVADDLEEDAHAVRAAGVVQVLAAAGTLPRSWGMRIRSLTPSTRRRGLRTLDLFLTSLLRDGAALPAGFVITLPKVTSVEQIAVFVRVLAVLEKAHELPPHSLQFEIQVETPQTVLAADGRVPVAQMIHAAQGRVSGLHFGTYDYTASLGILGAHQNLRHPVADFAKGLMMLAAAETGVRVSDGSDNKVPVGDPETVKSRWQAHAEGVQRALRSGIYQGWDLHPAQLPSRFAATFAFFRDGFAEAATRLAGYHQQLESGVMDEPATAFALARHLAAAVECGAVTDGELIEIAGIDASVVRYYLVRGAIPGQQPSGQEISAHEISGQEISAHETSGQEISRERN